MSKGGERDEYELGLLIFFAERSLHTGEVVGSIPTAPTTTAQQYKAFFAGALPCPPLLDSEQNVFPPAKLGENEGDLFDRRSASDRAKVAP